MDQGRTLVVIPARLGSERLPRKPLHPIAGRPLIEWVWRRVTSFGGFDRIIVATDSEDIASVCRGIGAEVALTSTTHTSGTDRVAEVARQLECRPEDILVNVQGDEPFVNAEEVRGAADLVRAGWEIGTVATPVRTVAALQDPGVVKVVRADDGGALLFSRAPIPFARDGWNEIEVARGGWLRHVGIYAYTAATLRRWTSLPDQPLETIEKLEQLRALAAGIRIGVFVVQTSERGVDTPEDARRAETRLIKYEGSPETTLIA